MRARAGKGKKPLILKLYDSSSSLSHSRRARGKTIPRVPAVLLCPKKREGAECGPASRPGRLYLDAKTMLASGGVKLDESKFLFRCDCQAYYCSFEAECQGSCTPQSGICYAQPMQPLSMQAWPRPTYAHQTEGRGREPRELMLTSLLVSLHRSGLASLHVTLRRSGVLLLRSELVSSF